MKALVASVKNNVNFEWKLIRLKQDLELFCILQASQSQYEEKNISK